MLNDRLAQLIARKLSGEATAAEMQELEQLLTHNPQAQYFFEVLSNYWSLQPSAQQANQEGDAHFNRIIQLAEEEEHTDLMATEPERGALRRLFVRIVAAAVFFGVAATGFWWWQKGHDKVPAPTPVSNEVVAKAGAKSYLLLPDGSKVWLNSASRLEYKGSFNDSIREVTLEGEAFFDVVKDPKRPFIVHTSDIDIRVLGTAFNVKSYPRDPVVEATLVRGLIEVSNKHTPSAPTIFLRPHEKLTYKKVASLPDTEPATASQPAAKEVPDISIAPLPRHVSDSALAEISWRYNRLVFEGETFREMAQKMERWYNVQIRFSSERVANYRFRVQFENETIEQALQALQVAKRFTYKIEENQIIIGEK